MSKFWISHSPTFSLNLVILCSTLCLLVLTDSVNLVQSLPAESSTVKIIEAGNLPKATTTTIKPVRHPNYVRLLKRTKNQNDTDEAPSSKLPSSTTTTTTTTTTAKPRSVSRVTNDEKIKSIIVTSQSEQTERPRGLGGLFSFLTRPRLSIFNDNVASSSNNNKTSRTGKPSNGKNSTLSSSNSLISPGSILASVMKALQGVTITFENMVMSFVNLFSLNGNRGGLGRLFGGSSSSKSTDNPGGFKITPSSDNSGFKIQPDLS